MDIGCHDREQADFDSWIVNVPLTHLMAPEREAIMELLYRNMDIFAVSEYDLGHTSLVQHEIPLSANQPIKQKPYRIPFRLQDEGHATNIQHVRE
jgi:hypothetical protein